MNVARITLVTLGVEDVGRAARFYEALGWKRTAAGNESVAFMQGEAMVLSLFGRSDLARDAGVDLAQGGFAPVALAVNFPGRDEVDGFFARAVAAGAKAVKPPEDVFWGGYSGYFADPDGHLWEPAHNPFFAMNERGHLDLATSERQA